MAAGQGTGNHKLAVSTAVVDRLRRRLRSNGFRAHLTLQMVPEDDDLISNVHITPLRASRALALRYLANKFNLDMERITVRSLTLPCRMHASLHGMLYFMLHNLQVEKSAASNLCCVQSAFASLEVSVKAEISRLYSTAALNMDSELSCAVCLSR